MKREKGTVQPDDWRRLNQVFESAIDLPLNEQDAFLETACGDDGGLRMQAERLLAAARKIGDEQFLSDDAFQVGARIIAGRNEARNSDGRHIGRFKIVSQIAHGGMGDVYLAERDDFQQRVALKLIRDGFDSLEILRRFRIERDVLASLNHPNIARLLDGGTTDDGQPFLAIEYVEGERIDDYCDSHELDLNERLLLFRKVCAAVAYAHQNLTVHRDLKPSNILVTPDGEPKLLDFGIAKLLAGVAATDETATADRLLTPEYASPEQLRGEKISTASDVYSLGVLLFELLTGRRPFELKDRSAFEIVDAVCNTEPPAPSSRSSEAKGSHSVPAAYLKGDLDKIVLTALRKDPKLRYSSVEQLSEDIRRHLDGLPIAARPMTFKYRAGKFVRRNRVPVAFASFAVLALVAGAAIASWQAIVARNEAAIAKQRFNDVRTLANTFVSDWHEGIPEEDIPPEVRARLADISSDYLAKLGADTDDPEVLREAADAQIKLGHEYAYFMIDIEKARTSFRNAEQIARRLLTSNPNDSVARSLLIQSLLKYDEFFGPEDLDAMVSRKTEQIALREMNIALAPDDATELRHLALAHQQLADALVLLGRAEDARSHDLLADELHSRRIAILENLPATSKNLARLSYAHADRASNLSENLGDAESSVGSMRRAVSMAAEALQAAERDISAERAAIDSQHELGRLLARSGDHERAIAEFKTAITVNRGLGANADAYFKRRECDSLLELGAVLYRLGRNAESAKTVQESLRVWSAWELANKGRVKTNRTHAFLFEQGGRVLAAAGRIDEAAAAFDEAEQYIDRTRREGKQKVTTGPHYASLMVSRGDMYAGVMSCRPSLFEGHIDRSCFLRSMTKRRDPIERAAECYRRAIEFIESLPPEVRRTYYDIQTSKAAAERLELLTQSFGPH